MIVRRVLTSDAPALAALHAESFGSARWSERQIADSLALATTYAWAAEDEGALRGFILCQITSDEAEILTFCVAPSARRCGVGQELLRTALDAAKAAHVRRLLLEVASDNAAAIALYEKIGFRVIGTRRGYYQHGDRVVDAVMMKLGG